MRNPWEEISLEDYENHMRLDSVRQLQALDALMKEQFEAYPVRTATVLGAAGGNGLEHVRKEKYDTVYCVDINGDYLRAIPQRYPRLAETLRCLRLDLLTETGKLPRTDLVIANLLVEYIGYPAFQAAVRQAAPEYVSCVIQINTDTKNWVSDSPYLHVFDRLDEVHHQMEEDALTAALAEAGYTGILRREQTLPNGKALVRLDFQQKNI